MHTTSKVTDTLVLLTGDYDARLASRNMELVDLKTLESSEIIVRDYHPGTGLFYQEAPDQIKIVSHYLDVASAASISICNNSK